MEKNLSCKIEILEINKLKLSNFDFILSFQKVKVMTKSKPATRIFFEELEDSPVVEDVSWRCSSAILQKRSSDVHEILFDSS